MDDILNLLRLLVSTTVAAGIIYGLYRGLRWRFPRVGKRRIALIVTLGTIALGSVSFSLLRTGGVECLQHENTVILRGERVLSIRKDEDRPTRPVTEQAYARVQQSCAYLIAHCPLEAGDETRQTAESICLKATAGQSLN